jgi:glycosyltransferase involved in cell wall biosynthesis
MKPSKKTVLVECRIVACDRPELLKRAIQSLKNQTYPHWKAIVFDDSRTKTGQRIVKSFKDKRIKYRWNKTRLGSTDNLNQGFSRKTILGGHYAFVLEDDNAIEKNFIKIGLRHCKKSGFQIVSVNQRSVVLRQNGIFEKLGIIRDISKSVKWDYRNLFLNAFCGESLPNGGYFWKIGGANLEVDAKIREPQLQECIRQTLVKTPILLAKEVGSVWTLLPVDLVRRTPENNRIFGLTLFLFSKSILRRYGFDEISNWLKKCSNTKNKIRGQKNLATVAHVTLKGWPSVIRWPKEFVKGIAKTIVSKKVVPAPIQEALCMYAKNSS